MANLGLSPETTMGLTAFVALTGSQLLQDNDTVTMTPFTRNVTSFATNDTSTEGGAAVWNGDSTIRDTAMKAVYLLVSSLGLVGNALVVAVLLSFKNLREKLTNMFIIHQSILDFLTALFLLLTTLLPYDGRGYYTVGDDMYCRMWVSRLPLWFFIHMSTYNLVLLTIERYFSVVHPILHKLSFTRAKALIGVGCIWALGIIYDIMTSTLTAKIEDGQCKKFLYPDPVTQQAVGVFSICLNYFIPIIILIYCYSRMAWSLHLKISPSDAHPAVGNASQAQKKDSLHKRGLRNIIKTLAIVATCFILCLSWNQIFFFLYQLGLFDYTMLQSNFYHFSVVAMFANCCTNPFIYTAKYEQFQKAIKTLFCQRLLKRPDTHSHSENTVTSVA